MIALPQISTALLLRCALSMSAAFLFYSNLDLYGNENWSTPSPTVWVGAFAVASLVLVALRPLRLVDLACLPLLTWCLFFFALTTLWAVFLRDIPRVWQEVFDRYRSLALVVALLIMAQEPVVRRASMFAVAAGVVLASLVHIGEALAVVPFPASPERVPGRAGGLYVNANVAGIAIALGLAAAAGSLPRRWRVPLLLLGATGVALTFSRSAALSFAVLVIALAWTGTVRLGTVALVALLVGAALVFFSADLTRHLELSGVLNANTLARLRLSHDDSGRLELARRAWGEFLASPLVGNGIGSTADWDVQQRPHNEYLCLGADHGLLGALAMPALGLALIIRNRGAIPFVVTLLTAGFFSHTLLVARPPILLIALVGAGAGRLEARVDEAEASRA